MIRFYRQIDCGLVYKLENGKVYVEVLQDWRLSQLYTIDDLDDAGLFVEIFKRD